jgi:hypothetical protein
MEQARLGGLLAFIQDVEPDFLRRLIVRYETTLVADIKAIKKPSRIS